MAFFGIQHSNATRSKRGVVSFDFLHEHECAVCPLNNQPGLRHPKMAATGSSNPDVYILAEAPGATEDRRGRQMIGAAGQILRHHLPAKWLDRIRWNNCVRTRPPDNRTPVSVEIECCRPSVVKDIEETRPQAIFGFG